MIINTYFYCFLELISDRNLRILYRIFSLILAVILVLVITAWLLVYKIYDLVW